MTLIPGSRPGSTYVIATKPYDGWAKIGRTAPGVHPNTRVAACQTGNARALSLRCVWPTDVEWYLHRVYAEFRGQGEWFALPLKMVQRMAWLARRPEPWIDLVREWPPRRIWEEAGPNHRGRMLHHLAQSFMSLGAEAERGSARDRPEPHVWWPTDTDRRLLEVGAPLEVVCTGALIECRALSRVPLTRT